MFFLVKNMIICLTATILIECIVAILLRIRNRKDIINIILANILTNPLVVSIPVYFNILYGIYFRNIAYIILEICAVIAEAIIYKKFLKFDKINPFVISIILNIASFGIGELTNFYIRKSLLDIL